VTLLIFYVLPGRYSETNIHYPTDATLLADGVRVLTRSLQRLGQPMRQRTRSVARRVFEIAQRSRTAGHRVAPAVRDQSKARTKVLYQGLMGITRALVRQAEAAAARSRRQPRAAQLVVTIELVKRVAQTRARVLRGDTHCPGKVVRPKPSARCRGWSATSEVVSPGSGYVAVTVKRPFCCLVAQACAR
jgi:hypothetical protein